MTIHTIKQRSLAITAACALMLSMSGCGHNQLDRTLSGTGIGAGAGYVAGALVGGSASTGLLLGAGVGAVAGAITNPEQLNLGAPLWDGYMGQSLPPPRRQPPQ